MDILIKIPKEVYEKIQSKSTEIQAEDLILENAVLNGKPLPKGHGDLVDRDGEFDQEEVLNKVKWELEEAQKWSFITHSEYEGLRLAINIIDKHRDEYNKEGKNEESESKHYAEIAKSFAQGCREGLKEGEKE